MKKVIGLFILVLMLAACGGTDEAATQETVVEETAVEMMVDEETMDEETAVSSSTNTRLQANYADALNVQSQLAVGTLKLEESPQAVNETQAAALLPLWRAYQSLSQSDITADVEIEALLNQIQGKMTAAQLEAISALALTDEDVAAMLADGSLVGGLRGGGDRQGAGEAGGFPGGGGLPGGRPGGGPGGGGDVGAVDQDAIATRRAERFGSENPEEAFQELMLVNAVTRLMGEKTGEVTDTRAGGGDFALIIDSIAAELDMDVDALRAEMGGDGSLADIIVANGGDVDAMHALLVDALANSDAAATPDDLDAFVTDVLSR